MIEPRPVPDGRLRLARVLRHVLVGAGGGFAAGGLTAAGILAWEAHSVRWAGALVALAVLCVPAGMILGAGLGLAAYRSRSGVEWALVGAAAAALFVASLGQLRLRPFGIALALFVLTGWLAARATAWACGTPSRDPHPAGKTLLVYGATALALAVVYRWIFEVALLGID